MPLFAWSGHREITSTPQSANGVLAKVLGSDRNDELVMVYMFDEVSTVQMQKQQSAFINLQDVLEKAESSSFAALPVSKVNIDSILATARVNGVTGIDVESSKLQAYMAAHPELMTNSKPEVVVVRFPATIDSGTADAIIGSTEKAVSASTLGKYTSILTTTSSMEPGVASNLAFKFFASSDMGASSHYVYNGNLTAQPGRSALLYGSSFYLTPTLMISILVMIYMGVLALAAYCCILSLQTPEMFEGDHEFLMQRALNGGAESK